MNDESKILDMVASQVSAWINVCVDEADRYTLDMNEDYAHFFCWHSEDMYKVQQQLKEYRILSREINTGDLGQVKEFLRHTVEHYTDDLLYSDVRKHSTGKAFNTAHLLDREVKQDTVRRYSHLLARIKGKEEEK